MAAREQVLLLRKSSAVLLAKLEAHRVPQGGQRLLRRISEVFALY